MKAKLIIYVEVDEKNTIYCDKDCRHSRYYDGCQRCVLSDAETRESYGRYKRTKFCKGHEVRK